ncbi:two-partner secretion domain-containing protein [Coleofasciculus chthonoplastes]|nr:filamentous hemagglutinin N-terminal domain-containing protein [Coleofasciculus chthonoplastes]
MASTTNLKGFLWLGLFPFLSMGCWFSGGLYNASAQILPDNTLGAESSRITNVSDIRELIEGGAIRGSHLFHSFEAFNIGEGQEAYFANPVGIESIFSRVTGNDPSAILGTLGVNGAANLFFLNPNGIIFGENAQLDIRGSFVASTANRLVFDNGVEFSATNPESAPLLTINLTPGLQYGQQQPAAVVNTGNLVVGEGENLTLVGGTVLNVGQLSAPGGTISVAAVPSQSLIQLDLTGQVNSVDLLFDNDTGEVLSSASGLATLLENAGLTQANIPIDFHVGTVAILGSVNAANPLGTGGEVNMTGNRIQLLNGVIDSGGVTGGEINLTSTFLENRGQIQADGERGGSLNIKVSNFLDTGVLSATGSAGDGGTIQVDYQGTVIQTASALTTVTGNEKAGRIRFQGGRVLTTSGNLQAQGEFGGEIQLFGERLQLLGTQVNASGNQGGGEILVGGDYQGNTVGAENAEYTVVNHGTTLQADGLTVGDGGKVIVWADGETDFYGSLTARGGELGGNGGVLEVSGKERLVFGGLGDASAVNGVAGELLLDPKNITIDTAVTGNSFQLFDPNPALGNQFGYRTAVLANNNIVVGSPYDDLMAEDAGVVYLFDSITGTLLGSIHGANPEDRFGGSSFNVDVTALSNGNYVFGNPDADIGGVENAGTVILANGSTGAEISRISGTHPNDFFGLDAIIALSNNNYVFGNPDADIGGVENAGTVILANGSTGAEINRISGTHPNDNFGLGEITALSNGNYVFGNPDAEIGGVENAGTVILANGSTGAEINRISGTNLDDNFGLGEITALSNGNYVFGNSRAEIGGVSHAGTVILADGTTGVEINRISGTNIEQFGDGEITALSNGNYVFGNSGADSGGVFFAGTVILANGTTGAEIRRISGTHLGDSFGSDEITALSNGNYVFGNPGAEIGGVKGAGTVILANGTTGAEISRISGTHLGDSFGSDEITALSNGNYVFGNSRAEIGGVKGAGTVILANGTTGAEISRISGTNLNDSFGSDEITALSNGNYVFGNPFAEIGGVSNAGTVILVNGTTGAEISRISSNNLFGKITALSNGNYLVANPLATGGGRVDIGIANPNSLTHSYFPNRNITLTPSIITSITDTGTAVTLQANNDITVNQIIITDNPTGIGGSLSLQAGRNILLNADITTDNGNLSLFANQPLASGVINLEREPGAAEITMQPGTTINTGFGNVSIQLDTGEGLTHNAIGTVTLGNINAENLTVNSAGAILGNGILTINSDATFTSTLANAGNVSVTNTNPTTIGYSIIGGNFRLNSAFPISQVPGEPLQVSGNISVNGGSSNPLINNIGLPSSPIQQNGDLIISQVGTVNLPTNTVTGNLTVNSLPEAVLSFNAVLDNPAITLNQANSFGGTLRFRTSKDAISTTGIPGITQSGTQIVVGTATFRADAGNINLTDSANEFGTLSFTGNDVSISANNDTTLLTSTATGNLTLNSGGIISQIGGLTVAGDASFTTTLPNAGNVILTNQNATVLGNSLIGGHLTLDSGGSISQLPGERLQVAGETTILNPASNPNLETNGSIIPRLNLPNGDVIITEVGTINLEGETFSGNLTVNSLASALQFIPGSVYENPAIILTDSTNNFGGTLRFTTDAPTTIVESGTPGIIQSGSLGVSGTATFNAENGNITLNDSNNQFGNLAFTGQDISIRDNGTTNLLNSTATGNLTLISDSGITQNGNLIVTGTSDFTTLQADAPITLTNNNQLTGDIRFTTKGTGNVTLLNTLANTQLAASNVSGDFTITSGGAITQTEPLNLTGLTTFNAGNSDIILNQNNDLNRLGINGGRTVIINDSNDINLINSSVSGSLNVNAIGDITSQDIFNPSGAIKLTSTNGSIDTTAGTLSTFSLGAGGAINLSAQGNITFDTLDARGVDIASGNITLTSQGRIASANGFIRSSTSGLGKAGDINIQAESVSFTDRTILSASTLGSGEGGTININTDEFVELLNGSLVRTRAIENGDAGDVTVNTQRFIVKNTRSETNQATGINTGTAQGSSGAGGNLTINASESVELIGNQPGTFIPDINQVGSVAFAAETLTGVATTIEGSGNAGNLTINTGQLTIQDRAGISTSTLQNSTGNGGELRLNVSESITLQRNAGIATATLSSGDGGNLIVDAGQITLTDGSLISADTVINASGDAGDIEITTNQLNIFNGSRIGAATVNEGASGDVTIKATNSVNVIGTSANGEVPSGIFTETRGAGDAGDLTLQTQQLQVRDGAQITAATSGGKGGRIQVTADTLEATNRGQLSTTTAATNDAGDIILEINDTITLTGKDSGLFANTMRGSTGNGGSIFSNSRTLTLDNSATIAVNSQGSGEGGNIQLDGSSLSLDNGSTISAETTSNQGGNITLGIDNLLLLRHGSKISTTAGTDQAGGDGGNIIINADFITGIPEEDSDITANAFSGKGGQINITTNRVIGLEFRENLTPLSDITASSEIGVDGEVVIDDLGIDPVQGAVELPTDTESPPLTQGCQPGEDGRGRFVNTERGGIPPSPSDPISSSVGWEDIQPATFEEQQSEETTAPKVIVEAQGWYVNERGEVILYANRPSTSRVFTCQ